MTNVDEDGLCLECYEPVCEECDLHQDECKCYYGEYAKNQGVERPIR